MFFFSISVCIREVKSNVWRGVMSKLVGGDGGGHTHIGRSPFSGPVEGTDNRLH